MKEVNNNYKVSFGEEPGYSDFTAEIVYQNRFFGLVTQEDGFNNLRLEIFPKEGDTKWDVSLEEFLEVLDYAKKRLWELRKD